MPKNNERMIMYLLAAAVLVLAYVLAFRQKKESFGTEVLKLVPPESMRGPVPKGESRTILFLSLVSHCVFLIHVWCLSPRS